MDVLRKFSAAALAAILVVGAMPALAQTRDDPTRGDPDRPQIEHSDGDNDPDRQTEGGRLPKGTPGMVCELTWDDNEITGVQVSNDTGKTIPVGTVVTVYVQPGDIQKQYKVTVDWHAGTAVDIAIDVGGVTSIAACSMKVQPERSGQLPQPAEETPWYLKGEVSFYCFVNWHWNPPPARPFMLFENDGDVMIPAGTTIVFMLPLGEAMTYVLEEDWYPGQSLEQPMHYSSEMEDFYSQHDKEHQACTYEKVETGDTGPAVEEQGPVPGIDPAKIP